MQTLQTFKPLSRQTLLLPLVGAYYRPPAALILAQLPAATPLILEPEPDNPHDPDAIIVKFSISQTQFDVSALSDDELLSMGLVHADLERQDEIQLGYIARQQSELHPRGPAIGNTAALQIINSGPNWHASLAFTPDGKPAVKLQESH